MQILHRSGVVVAVSAWLLSPWSPGQTPDNLLSLGTRIRVEASGEVTHIDRQTGRLVSEAAIQLTNVGDRPVRPPFVVVVELDAPQGVGSVDVAGAEGGVGVSPWQWPWLDLSNAIGAELAPGGVVGFDLSLSRPAGVTPLYHLVPYGQFNRDPVAVPEAAALAIVNQPLAFDGSASTDPDGDPLTHAWDFGDDTTGGGVLTQHAYPRTGTFQASLMVTDPGGASNTRNVQVMVVPEGVYALARTRALAGDGQPLDGVVTEETGPGGTAALPATASTGFQSLGGAPGAYVWRFGKPGYLTVWRRGQLEDGELTVVPSPWLTRLDGATVELTPLFERRLTSDGEATVVRVPENAVSAAGTARLTSLGPQGLPFPLPLGWSPVTALHLTLDGAELVQPAELTVEPSAPVRADAPRVLARFDEQALQWVADGIAPPGAPLTFALSAEDTYAVVLPDAGTTAPPDASMGAPLSGYAGVLPDLDGLTGEAVVEPNPGLASTDPAEITGRVRVRFTAGADVPSGLFLATDIEEFYTLRTGDSLPGLPYDTSIFAYRSPAGGRPGEVVAEFPIRPSEALGAETLAEALVHAQIRSPTSVRAGIVTADGGSLSLAGLRLDAAPGAFARPGIVELRDIDPAGLAGLLAGLPAVRAFEVHVSGLGAGQALEPFFSGLAPDADYLLARVVRTANHAGLEPVLRLHSDGNGRGTGMEPAGGLRLPGLAGAGRFVLTSLAGPVGLVDGVGRDATGLATGNLLARVDGLPWLAITRADGGFQLVAPPGDGSASLADDFDEDFAQAEFSLPDAASVAMVDLVLSDQGLRIAETAPEADATDVSAITGIRVRFNRRLDPDTFGTGAVALLDSTGAVVSASVSLSLSGIEASLLPTTPLTPASSYRVVLDPALHDLAGHALAGMTDFAFTTAGLPARPGSELVIYEPGAENVPQDMLDRVIGYTPGDGSQQIVVAGGPGVAEGDAPVTLVNVASGETTTVLAGPDGSFADWLRAEEGDYVQAVLFNHNGTRTVIDATRQLFDDGRVGLYSFGGLLAEDGPDGSYAIDVAPDALKARTVFKLTPMTVAEINAALGGVSPAGGSVAAGARLDIRGPAPDGASEVSFPLDPAALNLGPGETPENGAFGLAVVEYIDGDPVFRIVDKMTYADGQVSTASPPFAGLLLGLAPSIAYALDVQLAAIFLGAGPHTITGHAALLKEGEEVDYNKITPPVPGASVFAFKGGSAEVKRNRFGRIPGWVYGVTAADGRYALVVAGNPNEYSVAATHPRYPNSLVGGLRDQLAQVSLRNILFRKTDPTVLRTSLTAAHAPVFPSPGQAVTLTVTAAEGGSGAPVVAVQVMDVVPLEPGITGTTADVLLDPVSTSTAGGVNRSLFTVSTPKPLRVVLSLKAEGETVVRRTHAIDFNGVPPLAGGLSASDPFEIATPMVEASFPRPGDWLPTGRPVEIVFNEPIDRSVLDHLDLVVLYAGPTTGGATSAPGSGSHPTARLSDDQRTLELWFPNLEAGRIYTLLLPPAAVRDLVGNHLDQDPATRNMADPFTLTFLADELITARLPDVNQAKAGILRGSLLYIGDAARIDAFGDRRGAVRVFDVSQPQFPRALPELDALLNGPPTAMALLPDYAFWAKQVPPPGEPPPDPNVPEIRRGDLLAVVGGFVGSALRGNQLDTQPKFLRLFELVYSDDPDAPVELRVLATSPVHAADSIVTKLIWRPPHLAFLEQWSDISDNSGQGSSGGEGEVVGSPTRSVSRISLLNVQTFLTGNQSSREEQADLPLERDPGFDLNGDGDYTDPGEVKPTPSRIPTGFYGFEGAYFSDEFAIGGEPVPHDRMILDFDYRGGLVVGCMTHGYRVDEFGRHIDPPLPARFRVFAAGDELMPPDGVLELGFSRPKRVLALPDIPVEVPQPTAPDASPRYAIEIRSLALVSLSPDEDGETRLAVIDISTPTAPALVHKIAFPADYPTTNRLGLLQSISLREDGMIEVAADFDSILLDPRRLLHPPPAQPDRLHASVLGLVSSSGTGVYHPVLGPDGLRAVAEFGRAEVMQRAPEMEFRFFPTLAPDEFARDYAGSSDLVLDRIFRDAPVTERLAVSRYRTATALGVDSTLLPASPLTHYTVVVRAPGGGGQTLDIGMQVLDAGGRPLGDSPAGFAPSRALADDTVNDLGGQPADPLAPRIRPLRAYRMSDRPGSRYYNTYVSEPFAMVIEEMSASEVDMLRANGRQVFRAGHFVQAFIDASEEDNPGVGAFAATVDIPSKRLRIAAATTARTMPTDYVPGVNPPPVVPGRIAAASGVRLPYTAGMVVGHSGEVRHETTDLALPSRRMPIVFTRVAANQDMMDGPFGPGWDHRYNQRLFAYEDAFFPRQSKQPIVNRGSAGDSVIAEAKDLVFVNGMGRAFLFRHAGEEAPAGIADDPLAQTLGWFDRANAWYLPGEDGVFDFFAHFKDGKFARLGPDGTQTWFQPDGRLDRIVDRYEQNQQQLYYTDGKLRLIDDLSVNVKRFIKIGYWREQGDPSFDASLDLLSPHRGYTGKIARLVDYVSESLPNADVRFYYREDGYLDRREGPEAGAGQGYSGRTVTRYLWEKGRFKGAVNADSVTQGAPLFAAQINFTPDQVAMSEADRRGPVATGGATRNGTTGVQVPADNSAANNDGAQSDSQNSAGHRADLTFDAHGNPQTIRLSGEGTPAEITFNLQHDSANQVRSRVSPEGDTVTATYDDANDFLRSRGNLLSRTVTPGDRGGGALSASFAYDPRYNRPSGAHTDYNGFDVNYTMTDDGRNVGTIAYPGTPNSFVHEFAFNGFGQLKHELRPDGRVVDYDYDSDTGFLRGETESGYRRAYDYDASRAGRFGMPTKVSTARIDAEPYMLSYDQRLLLLELKRGAYRERYTYDEIGNLRTIERDLAPGHTLREERTYDSLNHLKTVVQQQVESSVFGGSASAADLVTDLLTYDDLGRLRERLTPAGVSEKFDYNHLGQLTRITRGPVVIDRTYDASGNLQSESQGGVLVRAYGYDGHNRPIEIRHFTEEGIGDTESIDYVAAGREVTREWYDSLGELNASTTVTYDPIGRPLERRTNGAEVRPIDRYEYFQGNPLGGLVSTRTFTAEGATLAPEITTQTVLPSGFLRSQADSLGTTTFTPDDNLNVEQAVSEEPYDVLSLAFTTRFTYDPLDYLLTVDDDLSTAQAGGQARTTYTRRPDGLADTETDGRGHQTTFRHSKLGELLEQVRPNGVVLADERDAGRRITAHLGTDGDGAHFVYDNGSDRLNTRYGLDGRVTIFGNYDLATEKPLSGETPGGTFDQTFDRRGRLRSRSTTYLNGHNYQMDVLNRDALGRIRQVRYGVGGGNEVTFDYDIGGPLLRATWSDANASWTVSYGYYPNGYLRSTDYPSDVSVLHSRDSAGRLLSVTIKNGGSETTVWDVQDFYGAYPPASLTLGPVEQENNYDNRRRLSGARWTKSGDGTLLARMQYFYDAADNLIARQEVHRAGRLDLFSSDPGNRITYAHYGARPRLANAGASVSERRDPGDGDNWTDWARWPQTGIHDPDLNLVQDASSPGRWQYAYAYDTGGLDLLERARLTNPEGKSVIPFVPVRDARDGGLFAKRLADSDGTTLLQRDRDAQGNTTRTLVYHRDATTGKQYAIGATLDYDAENRLVQVVLDKDQPTDPQQEYRYTYRFDNLRDSRIVLRNGAVEEENFYIYDGNLLIEEWTHLATDIVPDYELTARYFYADSDVPFAADLSDTNGVLHRYYYLTDHQKSVHTIVDSTGDVQERIRYDAFGQPRIEGQDKSPPVVYRVLAHNDGITLLFSETVLPPLKPDDSGEPVPFQMGIHLVGINPDTLDPTNLQFETVYLETFEGLTEDFGAALHLAPNDPFSEGETYTVSIDAGTLVDEWGNPSEEFTYRGTNFAAPATGTRVVFEDLVAIPGETAPPTPAAGSLGNHLLFHGQVIDFETGFYYLRARHYDPLTGEFLQRDPVEYEDSPNPYAAFLQHPMHYRDPSGMQSGDPRKRTAPIHIRGISGTRAFAQRGDRQVVFDLAELPTLSDMSLDDLEDFSKAYVQWRSEKTESLTVKKAFNKAWGWAQEKILAKSPVQSKMTPTEDELSIEFAGVKTTARREVDTWKGEFSTEYGRDTEVSIGDSIKGEIKAKAKAWLNLDINLESYESGHRSVTWEGGADIEVGGKVGVDGLPSVEGSTTVPLTRTGGGIGLGDAQEAPPEAGFIETVLRKVLAAPNRTAEFERQNPDAF